jgi:signal transduction histidine kinase
MVTAEPSAYEVSLLHNHLHRLAPEKRRELLGRITSSLRRMSEMLDDTLTLNRMDENRTELRLGSIHLADFVASMVEEIRLGDRQAHRFEILSPAGDPLSVVTDPHLLHHILSNLLSNAVRYSPADTLVRIVLLADAGKVQIAIVDQGIGIPPTDRARVFDAFERGSNVGNISGTGLGLNIVKRMTQLLSGTIEVTDAAGGGSRFTVTLPLELPTASKLRSERPYFAS